ARFPLQWIEKRHVGTMDNTEDGEQKKEREERKRPSTTPQRDPPSSWPHSRLPQQGRRPLDHFGRGPEYGPGSDSAESYRSQPDYEDRHSEGDSAGSSDPYMEYYEGYVDYEDRGECSDVSLRSNLGSNYVEDPPMEVEEVSSRSEAPGMRSLRHLRDRPRLHLGGAAQEPANHSTRHKERRPRSRKRLPLLEHIASELMRLYLSLVEARERLHQYSP
ncbi:hypothetical protein P4O66_021794, partial [Electrophorus voltai]